MASKIFSNMGLNSSPQAAAISPRQPPQDIHSDAFSLDDLPSETSRTPLKSLQALGPLDVYLGSSPTPSARSRSQPVRSDDTEVATPNAVRTVHISTVLEELGSSPPRFEKGEDPTTDMPLQDETYESVAGENFDYRQPVQPFSSIDEGTTVDDKTLLEPAVVHDEQDNAGFLVDTEFEPIDMPSSTIELQLDAQLNAEMNAQVESSNVDGTTVELDIPEESNAVYVDAPSQRLSQTPRSTKVSVAALGTDLTDTSIDRSSGTSRVGDSFSKSREDEQQPTEPEPKRRERRHSSRHSHVSTLVEIGSAKKRKQTAPEYPSPTKRAKKEEQALQVVPAPSKADESIQDSIIVASPASPAVTRSSKKKSRSDSQTPSFSPFVVPEATRRKTRRSQAAAESPSILPPTRKRGVRRSASSLGQVEMHTDDILVEDTPAPKKARQTADQDVSTAKAAPTEERPVLQGSQVKRLSHVQITPKTSGRASSSRASSVAASVVDKDNVQAQSEGEQNANVALQPQGDTASQSQRAASATPNRSFAERVMLTPKSILGRLKAMKDDLKHMLLGREEEREFDDAMFELRREVHAAGQRGEEAGK